ncbi:MAG: DNA polymerase IV [Nocardiaceae bacterium]|nr:DNA polymerase IV [Nocardiaceae bacterium]
MPRWVVHLDMDAFFASVEQLTRPTLRGRPVLVGGTGGRGVVAGASYEARVFGARSAMPMHQARRMIGVTAVVLPPRIGLYSVVSRQVFDVVRQRMPVLEMLSFDEAFGEPLQLKSASAEEAAQFALDLRQVVLDECALSCSVGVGPGKQVAKIASGMAKPGGVKVVTAAEQETFLAALPVRKLWGIGPVAEGRLRTAGIETVGALAALTEQEAASLLGGTSGLALHRLARGIDDRPVEERGEAKQISVESTFAADIITLAELRVAVRSLAASAHTRLRRDGRAARTVVVKLKKSDMSVLTRSATFPAPTADLDDLTAAALRLVLDPVTIGPVRLAGVGFGGLASTDQSALFSMDSGETHSETEESAPTPETVEKPPAAWRPGDDVHHPEFGHGWVQGGGHGVVSIRFETRSTGPGVMRTFAVDDAALSPADPLDSLH